jgi:hypothetical protein
VNTGRFAFKGADIIIDFAICGNAFLEEMMQRVFVVTAFVFVLSALFDTPANAVDAEGATKIKVNKCLQGCQSKQNDCEKRAHDSTDRLICDQVHTACAVICNSSVK